MPHQHNYRVLTKGQWRKEGFSTVYTRDWQTSVQGACAWFIKFYWNTATPIHLHTFHGHFQAATYNSRAEALQQGTHVPLSLKHLLSGPFQKKSADPWFTP